MRMIAAPFTVEKTSRRNIRFQHTHYPFLSDGLSLLQL